MFALRPLRKSSVSYFLAARILYTLCRRYAYIKRRGYVIADSVVQRSNDCRLRHAVIAYTHTHTYIIIIMRARVYGRSWRRIKTLLPLQPPPPPPPLKSCSRYVSIRCQTLRRRTAPRDRCDTTGVAAYRESGSGSMIACSQRQQRANALQTRMTRETHLLFGTGARGTGDVPRRNARGRNAAEPSPPARDE